MKKISVIIAIAALAASAACTKVDPNEGPAKKISFEVASYVTPATKAESSTFPGSGSSLFDEFASPKFYTYAYFYPALSSDPQGQVFMDNVEITPNAATSAATTEWAPADEYFWPRTGYINFFSYASKNAVTVDASNLEAQKKIVFGPKAIAADDNILLADACYNAKSANSSESTMTVTGEVTKGVPTLFRHLLCQVAFNIKLKTAKTHATTAYEVEVISASLSGVKTTGTLTLTNAGTTGTDLTIVDWGTAGTVGWVPAAATENVTFTVPASPFTLAAGATESSAASFLDFRTFLPQTLADDVVLNMTYKIKAKHGSTTYSEETFTMDPVKLNGSTISVWNMNEKITYNLELDPVTTIVTFDPAVVAWDASKTANLTI